MSTEKSVDDPRGTKLCLTKSPTRISRYDHSLSFADAIHNAVGFKPPILRSDRKLFQHFAAAADRFHTVGAALKQIGHDTFGFNFDPPALPPMGAHLAAHDYPETVAILDRSLAEGIRQLNERLDGQFGRIEWFDDDSCRFTFFEARRRYGLMSVTTKQIRHTHDLVKAKLHRLPATDVPQPRAVKKILRGLPPYLLPQVRIVTGLEILQDVGFHAEHSEPNAVGRFLASSAEVARNTASAVSAAAHSRTARNAAIVAGGAMGVAALIALAPVLAGALSLGAITGGAVQLAVADPALVIGEICLFGWEDSR